MGETFSQRTKAVNGALRRLRQQYRKADSQGELLERELDRLISRKTIVTPASLSKAAQLYESYVRAVNEIEVPFTDVLRVSGSYA